jgi:hypothetical protein
MSWRAHIATLLGGIILLAGLVALTTRPVVVGDTGVTLKTGLSSDQILQPKIANRLNATSLPKTIRSRPPEVSTSFEIPSFGDEGSLWDEGPVYDLSQ